MSVAWGDIEAAHFWIKTVFGDVINIMCRINLAPNLNIPTLR